MLKSAFTHLLKVMLSLKFQLLTQLPADSSQVLRVGIKQVLVVTLLVRVHVKLTFTSTPSPVQRVQDAYNCVPKHCCTVDLCGVLEFITLYFVIFSSVFYTLSSRILGLTGLESLKNEFLVSF